MSFRDSIAKKMRERKEAHPSEFCRVSRCLDRRVDQSGYCPKHRRVTTQTHITMTTSPLKAS